jgi:hypothetical protein
LAFGGQGRQGQAEQAKQQGCTALGNFEHGFRPVEQARLVLASAGAEVLGYASVLLATTPAKASDCYRVHSSAFNAA